MYDMDRLIRDFIPVLVEQANGTQKPAMFDRVNEKLYYNARSGGDDFQYGNED